MQMLSKRSCTNCLTIDHRLISRSSPRAIKRANLIHELGLGINRPDHFLRRDPSDSEIFGISTVEIAGDLKH